MKAASVYILPNGIAPVSNVSMFSGCHRFGGTYCFHLHGDRYGKRRHRGGAVGWGTALQVGTSGVRFPTVSLEFFLDFILPAALWPLKEIITSNIPWE